MLRVKNKNNKSTRLIHSKQSRKRATEGSGEEGRGDVDVMIVFSIDADGHHVFNGSIGVDVL